MKPLLGYRKPAPGTQPNHLYPPYVSSIKRAPKQPLISIPVTLSEITGPTFPIFREKSPHPKLSI